MDDPSANLGAPNRGNMDKPVDENVAFLIETLNGDRNKISGLTVVIYTPDGGIRAFAKGDPAKYVEAFLAGLAVLFQNASGVDLHSRPVEPSKKKPLIVLPE